MYHFFTTEAAVYYFFTTEAAVSYFFTKEAAVNYLFSKEAATKLEGGSAQARRVVNNPAPVVICKKSFFVLNNVFYKRWWNYSPY